MPCTSGPPSLTSGPQCTPSMFSITVTDSTMTYPKPLTWAQHANTYGANVLEMSALPYNAANVDGLLICITASAPCNMPDGVFGPTGTLTYSMLESGVHKCCPQSAPSSVLSSPPPPLLAVPVSPPVEDSPHPPVEVSPPPLRRFPLPLLLLAPPSLRPACRASSPPRAPQSPPSTRTADMEVGGMWICDFT